MNIKKLAGLAAILMLAAAMVLTAACRKKPKEGEDAFVTAAPNATAAPAVSGAPDLTEDPNATPAPVAPTVPAATADPTSSANEATPEPTSGGTDATAQPTSGAATEAAPTSGAPTASASATEPHSDPTPAATQVSGATPTPAAPTPAASADPVPTAVPTASAPSAEPTGTPSAPATPTPPPTPTPVPDPVVTTTWLELGSKVYCDLDFDSKPEQIELNIADNPSGVSLVTLRIIVGKNNKTLEDSFPAETFINALVNNFNSGDNRVEIIVSGRMGERDEQLKAYRLNERSDGLRSCKLEGSLYQIDGNSVRIHRYVDLMGTWDCIASFSFDSENFRLIQNGADWEVLRDHGRVCTLAEDILAGIYSSGSDNLTTFVEAGTRIYPIASDLTSRIDIVLESGAHGFITVTVGEDGRFMYGGTHLDDYFTDLYFLK